MTLPSSPSSLALPARATLARLALLSTVAAAAGMGLPSPAAAAVGAWSAIGPDGGAVAALAVDPADAQAVYAGTSRDGVFKSLDGGLTWSAANRGLPDLDVVALAIDPHRASTVYAAALSAVYVSADGGAGWSASALTAGGPASDDTLVSVAADPRTAGVVYAGTSSQLLVSHDAGRSVASAHVFPGGLAVQVAADPVRRQALALVLAVDGFHLYALPDGATALHDLTRTLAVPPALAAGQASALGWQVAADPAAPGALYLAYQLAQQGGGGGRQQVQEVTYRSGDGGATWSIAGPGGFPLAIGPRHTIYAGTTRSADGGASWTAIARPPDAVQTLAAGDSPLAVYAGGASRGVLRSMDGGQSWQESSAGLAATAVEALAVGAAAPELLFAYVDGQGLLRSRNGGALWRGAPAVGSGVPLGLVAPTLATDTANPLHLYLASLSGLAESLDAGATWSAVAPSGTCLSLDQLAVVPAGPGLPPTLYGVGALGGCSSPSGAAPCPTFESTDGGATWSCLGVDLAALAVAPALPSTLYGLGEPQGSAGATAVLYASTDAGATWRQVNAAAPFGNLLLVHPLDPGRLYVADAAGGLWRSPDGGAHWRSIAGGLPPSNGLPLLLAIDPTTPATLYAAASTIGVWRSPDGGGTWQPLAAGLPPLTGGPILSEDYVALLPAPPPGSAGAGTLYLATAGEGVLAYSFP